MAFQEARVALFPSAASGLLGSRTPLSFREYFKPTQLAQFERMKEEYYDLRSTTRRTTITNCRHSFSSRHDFHNFYSYLTTRKRDEKHDGETKSATAIFDDIRQTASTIGLAKLAPRPNRTRIRVVEGTWDAGRGTRDADCSAQTENCSTVDSTRHRSLIRRLRTAVAKLVLG